VWHPSTESVFVFGNDITDLRVVERRLADQAVLLAEQACYLADLARFPEMNPGPEFRLDLEGRILLANAAARTIFGEGVAGSSWLELCPGLDGREWAVMLGAVKPVPLEASVNEHSYVFTHRRDPEGDFVFVYGTDVTKQRLAEKALRQAERMATLGTLAAGVAHELNNPAAAARRSADQLAAALPRLEEALARPDMADLEDGERVVVHRLDQRARELASRPSDLEPVSRSDRETEVEAWLTARGIPDAADLSASLVELGLQTETLATIGTSVRDAALPGILTRVARTFPVYRLLHEISQASARISEIVAAMKGYSYLGQAPLKTVDIHEGLDNTLVILRSKLKLGITVQREYDRGIPPVAVFAGELNQVWTNLLDNAADAMIGQGHITIRTSRQGNRVVVEIEDDGPGIPEQMQSRIFDPFFTTKEPGKGTGLGLSTTYSIVRDLHGGDISVESHPGRTVFTVSLLIDNPRFSRDEQGRDYSGRDPRTQHGPERIGGT
jgi:signal transduction histidine kinase